MNKRPIIKPTVNDTFFYEKIISCWLYYYMIDEKEISYSTFMGYRNQDNVSSYNRSFTRNPYIQLMQKCGFERIPWRKLRNTYATILAEYDVSMKAIAASLGHYSPDFTESTYVKPG